MWKIFPRSRYAAKCESNLPTTLLSYTKTLHFCNSSPFFPAQTHLHCNLLVFPCTLIGQAYTFSICKEIKDADCAHNEEIPFIRRTEMPKRMEMHGTIHLIFFFFFFFEGNALPFKSSSRKGWDTIESLHSLALRVITVSPFDDNNNIKTGEALREVLTGSVFCFL